MPHTNKLRFCRNILFAIGCCLMSISSVGAMEDSIVAVVNEDIITLSDLKDYLSAVYFQLKSDGKSPAQIEAMMKDMEGDGIKRLVEDRLILSEAKKKGVEIRPDLINKRVDDIKKQYSSEQEFLNAIMRDGFTVTDLKRKVEDQFKVKFLVEEEVRSKIFVNPQEVTTYYKNHFEQFRKPERAELDSIYIPIEKDARAARIRAEEALTEIQQGKDFLAVAQAYSQAPSMGMMEKGQMLPTVESIVFKLNAGQTSSVVEVPNGFYIFKLKEKFPMEVASLEQAKERIYDRIFQQKFEEKFNSWVDKLKKDAFVEIKP